MDGAGSEPKKRKLNPPPRRNLSSPHANEERAGKSTTQSSIGSSSGMNMKIEQAKRFAVTQAQRDGCTGNYRIFDSPYGNFLAVEINIGEEKSDVEIDGRNEKNV